jgi:hypothetical protein
MIWNSAKLLRMTFSRIAFCITLEWLPLIIKLKPYLKIDRQFQNALHFKIWQNAYFSKTKPKIKSRCIAIIEENVLKEWKMKKVKIFHFLTIEFFFLLESLLLFGFLRPVYMSDFTLNCDLDQSKPAQKYLTNVQNVAVCCVNKKQNFLKHDAEQFELIIPFKIATDHENRTAKLDV